ncbi:MAG: MFS transporter [Candidatus Eremiobacteraeota bacterium]|nr:MFS transporter [Candidatus Eremiobacteraeota bacterium]
MSAGRSAVVERFGRRRYYGWSLVVALGVTTCISYGTSQYLFGLLVAPIRGELGWSNATLSSAYAGTVLLSGVAGLGAGRILDRIGARALMTVGSLLGALSLYLVSRATSPLEFTLLWTFGIGIASALTYYPVSFTIVANWFHRGQPQALALLTFMGAFASPAFYPLGGLLIARYGWREALVALAVVQLLVAFPLHAIFVRRRPEDYGLNPDGAAQPDEWTPVHGIAFGVALRTPSFWLIAGAMALSFLASTIVLLEHIAYLVQRGFAAPLVAALVGFFGIAYLPGRWLVAYASGRVATATQLAIVFALEAAGIVLLLFARDVVWVVAYVALFGIAYGALAPLRGAVIAERFGRRAYGEIFAAQNVVTLVVAAAGAVGAGIVVDRVGYASVFEVCIASCLAAAIVITMSQRRQTSVGIAETVTASS